MKKPILLFACICLCAIQTKAQSILNLSEWATANKTELTYQNNTYQSGSYMLSDGSRISYLKKTGTLEQEQNNTKENKLSLAIFPNPNNGNFDLQLTTYDLRLNNAEVRIYNVLGEIVYQQTLNFKHETLNTKLTKGVYFLQLQSEQGVWNEKVIVQ